MWTLTLNWQYCNPIGAAKILAVVPQKPGSYDQTVPLFVVAQQSGLRDYVNSTGTHKKGVPNFLLFCMHSVPLSMVYLISSGEHCYTGPPVHIQPGHTHGGHQSQLCRTQALSLPQHHLTGTYVRAHRPEGHGLGGTVILLGVCVTVMGPLCPHLISFPHATVVNISTRFSSILCNVQNQRNLHNTSLQGSATALSDHVS